MRIIKEAANLFAGILKTCMFEKGDSFSKAQSEFLGMAVSDASFEEFCAIFPVEKETAVKILEEAKKMGKAGIDTEVILSYFGGASHMEHVREDFLGLPESLVNLLLVFHAVVCVKLNREDGQLFGLYKNGNTEFAFRGIEAVSPVDINTENPDQKALIHYGSIFETIKADSKEEKILLEIQVGNELFMRTCRKAGSLDCESLLRALQLQRGKVLQ